MVDEISQDPAPEAEPSLSDHLDAAAGNSESAAPEATEEGFTGHPAWKPFEEALGPIHYHSIEPHLRSMSQAFEAKIAATNKALDPWKGLIDEQVDPQELVMSRQLMQEINSDPLGFYTKLEQYLRQTGQLEAAAAAADKVDELTDEQDPDEDPRIAKLQAEIAQLSQSQQQWLQTQQAQYERQQYEQQVSSITTDLEQQVQALKASGMDDLSIGRVLDRAELLHHRGGKPVPLAEIAQQVQQEVANIRSQPRPNALAPKLPGVSGGAPAQQAVDLSAASREQSRDTFAALIASQRGN